MDHLRTRRLIPLLPLLAATLATPGLRAAPDAPTVAAPAASSGVPAEAEFAPLELDAFIAQELAAVERLGGRKILKMAAPVSFQARLKSAPEAKDMVYIYSALEVAEVRPLPEVGHQMFLESAGGRVFAVYVEKRVAARLAAGLAVGQEARFLGYHVYSYKKGPAFLIVDFAPVEGSGEVAR